MFVVFDCVTVAMTSFDLCCVITRLCLACWLLVVICWFVSVSFVGLVCL